MGGLDTSPESIKCMYCDLYVPGKGNLEKHVQSDHKKEKSSLTCPDCHYQATSKDTLELHVQFSCYKCQYCDFKASSTQNLQNHIRDEHTTNTLHPYRCNQCEYTALTKANLELHVATNHAATTDRDRMTRKETKVFNCHNALLQHRQKAH